MKHGRSWLSALLISFSILSFAQKEPVDYVNTIIGASTSAEAGKSGHGLGKTFPGSCTPFGLVQLSPDTKQVVITAPDIRGIILLSKDSALRI